MFMTNFDNNENRILTDLNCHVLPEIDDGYKDMDDSISILLEEKNQNVKQIVFTPHFIANRQDLSFFLKERNKAASALIPFLEKEGFVCALGSEVLICKELLELDLKSLAITGTNYILLEWPMDDYCKEGKEVVGRCFQEGLIPIFSHVEKHEFFTSNLLNLEKYIQMGVVTQMSSDSLLESRIARRLLQEGYVHLLASNIHNKHHSKPTLLEALNTLDEDLQQQLLNNANAIFHNKRVKSVTLSKKVI